MSITPFRFDKDTSDMVAVILTAADETALILDIFANPAPKPEGVVTGGDLLAYEMGKKRGIDVSYIRDRFDLCRSLVSNIYNEYKHTQPVT